MKTRFFLVPLIVVVLAGCGSSRNNIPTNSLDNPATNGGTVAPPLSLQFTNITKSGGINFVHNKGAFGGKLMPETVGSGVAFIDYDGDGYQDLYLVNGRDWTEDEVEAYKKGKWAGQEVQDFLAKSGLSSATAAQLKRPGPAKGSRRHTTGKLYHNNRNGTFTDVTVESGLAVEMYGMGAAVGDYDNDGRPDLYVTAIGRNYLFRNNGKGKFLEMATQAGVHDSGWSTSAAWLDYDKDGKLDLFVGHYVTWSPATNVYSSNKGERVYGGPEGYPGQTSRLYHNVGNGRFVEVSARAGTQKFQELTRAVREAKYHQAPSPGGGQEDKVKEAEGKALGVVVCDYNEDSWPDIFVANDKVRNYLYKNNCNGTFSEVAVESGISFSMEGKMRAGMGVDAADIDHSGHESIVVGNFSDEMLGLYQNQGDGRFIDTAPRSEVGRASMGFLTFGLTFVDIDNDSWPDIFVANGHIDDQVKAITGNIEYAQRPLLFRNEGQGNFKEIGLQSGEGLKKPIVARGLAYADIDLDGDADVILTTNGGPPLLLRNDGGNANNVIRLILQGTRSNRSGIGARVEAKVGTETVRRMVRSGSSYLSQNELPVMLGLGKETKAASVTIRWPSGTVTELKDVAANQILTVQEGKGVVKRLSMTR